MAEAGFQILAFFGCGLGAVGALASSVVHDFNNLLTAITGYSGLALVNLEDRDPVRNDIEEIKESPLSIMPEGQLNSLSKDDIRDLIGFLSTP